MSDVSTWPRHYWHLQPREENPVTGPHLSSNNAITNDPCLYCGTRTDPCGFDVMEHSSLVCHECAEEIVPGEEAFGQALASLADAFHDLPLESARVCPAVVREWLTFREMELQSGPFSYRDPSTK